MTTKQIKSLETRFRGRIFRSRLEAKWAAFFDLMGWGYEYEPFAFAGWLPDFLLFGKHDVLVEVKPTRNPAASVLKKIESASAEDERDILLLGPSISLFFKGNDRVILGQLLERGKGWGHACLGRSGEGQPMGFCHSAGSPVDRITGIAEAPLSPTSTADMDEIDRLWAEAGNLVRWVAKVHG